MRRRRAPSALDCARREEKDRTVSQEITAIRLPLPYRLGSVNCYLIETGTGFILIDTGSANARADLHKALADEGCMPGHLRLIVLTHGDFDHAGNCAHLRGTFGAPVVMHCDDLGMVQRGDMFSNRRSGNALFRIIAPFLFRFAKSDRFVPDLHVHDGYDLSTFGFDARVIHIPGHSMGSIGILTAGGDLFCGDLLENHGQPALNSIMDDVAAANASVAKLEKLDIITVCPGHGDPFPMDLFIENRRRRGAAANGVS